MEKYDEIIEAYILKQGVKSGLTDSQQASPASVRESRPRDSKEEKERKQGCMERRICFVCGSPGHRAKTCGRDRKEKCKSCKTPGHGEKAWVKPTGATPKACSVESKHAEQEYERKEELPRRNLQQQHFQQQHQQQQASEHQLQLHHDNQLALEYDQPGRANAIRGSAPTPPILL